MKNSEHVAVVQILTGDWEIIGIPFAPFEVRLVDVREIRIVDGHGVKAYYVDKEELCE